MHFSNVLTTKVLKPSDFILEIKAEKRSPYSSSLIISDVNTKLLKCWQMPCLD